MNKTLPALAGVLLLAGTALGCASPGTGPDETPTIRPSVITTTGPSVGQPRGLTEQQRKKLPAQQRPVDVEALPWDGSAGKIQEFRIVVDEVTRYCLVLIGRDTGGLHCFDSSEVP